MPLLAGTAQPADRFTAEPLEQTLGGGQKFSVTPSRPGLLLADTYHPKINILIILVNLGTWILYTHFCSTV